jgi:2-methylisocitrate lyase-like PEP mutase family enzyme
VSNSQFLKQRLTQPSPLLCPGVFDALSAALAEQAGFDALYLSGASLAYTRLGQPDIGLVGLTEIADALFRIGERVETPIVIDADTGFGNAINVKRTVRVLERSGANAIQIEDQSFPKRCGHLKGKALISPAEMAGKVRAAVDARKSEDTLIIGRTDAIAVEGLDAALDRAERYLEAGADILFIEAPRSLNEMKAIQARFGGRVPLLANMVEGGATPLQSADALAELDFRLVIYPGALVRLLARTMGDFLAELRSSGTTAAYRDRMYDLTQLNDVLGTTAVLQDGARYDPAKEDEETVESFVTSLAS